MHSRLSYAALAAAGCLFGLGFVFGKIALAAMPLGAVVTWRFVAATIVLAPFLVTKRAGMLRQPRMLLAVCAAGLLYVPIQFLIAFKGLSLTSVTHASLMVALMPGLLAAACVMLFRHRIGASTAAAIALSVAGGIVIVLRPDHAASLTGDFYVFLSLIAAVAWVLFTQRYLSDLPPAEMSAAVVAAGTIALVVVQAFTHGSELIRSYEPTAVLAVCASGVLSTAVATVLWNVGLSRIHASRAGVFLNFEPLVGALCGVTFFGDPLGMPLLLGGILVLGGALLVQAS